MVISLQWSLHRYYNKLAEIQNLIAIHQPFIICLQATYLPFRHQITLSDYTVFRHDHTIGLQVSEGTPILVLSTLSPKCIPTSSFLQTVVISIKIPPLNNLITFCSIYVHTTQPKTCCIYGLQMNLSLIHI